MKNNRENWKKYMKGIESWILNSDFLFRGVKTIFLNKLEIVNNYSPVFSVLSFADKPFFPENIAPLVKGPEHLDGGDFSLHSVFFDTVGLFLYTINKKMFRQLFDSSRGRN